MQTSRTSFAGAASSNIILFVAGCPLMAPYDKGVIYLAMVTSRHMCIFRVSLACATSRNAIFVLAGCPLMAVCDFRSIRCGNMSLSIAGCPLMAVCDFRSTRDGNVWLLMDFVFTLVADPPAQACGLCKSLRSSRHVVKHVCVVPAGPSCCTCLGRLL